VCWCLFGCADGNVEDVDRCTDFDIRISVTLFLVGYLHRGYSCHCFIFIFWIIGRSIFSNTYIRLPTSLHRVCRRSFKFNNISEIDKTPPDSSVKPFPPTHT
jgi:hypothetical protein